MAHRGSLSPSKHSYLPTLQEQVRSGLGCNSNMLEQERGVRISNFNLAIFMMKIYIADRTAFGHDEIRPFQAREDRPVDPGHWAHLGPRFEGCLDEIGKTWEKMGRLA